MLSDVSLGRYVDKSLTKVLSMKRRLLTSKLNFDAFSNILNKFCMNYLLTDDCAVFGSGTESIYIASAFLASLLLVAAYSLTWSTSML